MSALPPATALQVYRSIRAFLSPQDRRALGRATVWALLAALASATVAALTAPVTQCLQGSCPSPLDGTSATRGVWAAVGVTVLVVGARLAVLAKASWSITSFQQGTQLRTTTRLLDTYLHMSWPDFSSRNQALYVQRALTTGWDAAYGAQQWVAFVGSATTVALLGTVLVLSAPWFLLLGLAAGVGVSILLSLALNRRMHDAAAQRERAVRGSTLTLTEALTSFKEIRSYGQEAMFLDRADRDLAEVARTSARLTFLPDLPRLTFDALGMIMVLALAAGWVVSGREISDLVPQLVLFAVVARTFQPALVALMASRATLTGSLINLQLILDDFSLADRAQPTLEPTITAGPPGWYLRGARFRHTEEGPEILAGAEAEVGHPSWTALVGPSGSGKTTILELLCGFRTPQQGDVGISWPGGPDPVICYVPQQVALLDGTVEENIVFGAGDLDPARLDRALGAAGLTEVVSALPDGSRTRIGPNGTSLSGGQRQRLAIARGLYRDPDLLLLDEATSGLDDATEQQVLGAIREQFPEVSVILVTHRAASLKVADQVLGLADGRVLVQTSAQAT